MKQKSNKYFPQLRFIGVLLIIFLLHTSYILNSFTWLDHGDIEQGRTIIPLSHFPDMFSMRFGETGFYRPLITFFNSLDYSLYQGFAPGYHVTNILLHLIVSALVPLFLSLFITLTLPEMLLVMLLFGLHPLSWLPVGAISYRPELLYSLFTILTVYWHHKARVSGKQVYGFFALLSFFLALLSKETALVLVPAFILIWEVYQRKVTIKKHLTSALPLLFSEVVVVALYLFLRFRAVPEVWKSTGIDLSFAEAIGTRMLVLEKMLMHFLTPFHIALSDAVPITSLFSFSSAFFIVLIFLSVWLIKKNGLYAKTSFFMILLTISLLPVLNIVSLPRFGSSHYGYLSLVMFCGLVVLFFRLIRKKLERYPIVTSGIIALWLICTAWTTWSGGWQFKNDKTLFAPEVAQDSHFLEGHFYLGNWYLYEHLYGKAEAEYKKALQSDPSFIAYNEQQAVRVNLSTVFLMQNKLEEAESLLNEAGSLPSTGAVTEMTHNRMILDYKRHNYQAVITLSQDVKALPYTPIIYLVIADSLRHLGNEKEAAKLEQTVSSHLTTDQKIQLQSRLKQMQ